MFCINLWLSLVMESLILASNAMEIKIAYSM